MMIMAAIMGMMTIVIVVTLHEDGDDDHGGDIGEDDYRDCGYLPLDGVVLTWLLSESAQKSSLLL